MADLFRPLSGGESDPAGADGQAGQVAAAVPLPVWLDALENERDALIMRLRGIDSILVTYGRLRHETISRRIR